MSNEFIKYLNSTNSAGSDTIGALAESQVKNPLYDKIKVDRKLGTYIAEDVKYNRHSAFILTGHAGDGKTSILVQVLKELKLINTGDGLDVEKEYCADGVKLYYVKDMSEVAGINQVKMLRKALSAPKRGVTSLLISNTGPLLNAFENLVREKCINEGRLFKEEEKIALQTKLLNQLDINSDSIIEIEEYEFVLVNIARIDNVSFSQKILCKMIQDELWESCNSCPVKDKCPIYFNAKYINNNFKRVSAFIENYYRFLYENDKRMTIRQMLAHLSFALTGNLTCEKIKSSHYKLPFYNYNFANLFFGYIGLSTAKQARQIKGIEQIQNAELDQIALDVDYKLFVNREFSAFSPEIRSIIEEVFSKIKRIYQINDVDTSQSLSAQQKEIQLRKSIRRFYLMYSLYDNINDIEHVLNQAFGKSYMEYVKLINEKQTNKIITKSIQTIIYQALYLKNTGFLPESQDDDLLLTLRRDDDVFQNVMLVLGSLRKNDINIIQKQAINCFEESDIKYGIYLSVGENSEIKLSLPLISYFKNIIEGSIASNNNPALTHGIAKLNTMLHEKYKKDADETELTILINTTKGQEKHTLTFDVNRVIVD